MTDGFEAFLIGRGLKTSSISAYQSALKHIRQELPDFSSTSLIAWLQEQYKNGKSGKYLNHYLVLGRLWGKYNNDDSFAKLKFFKEKETFKSCFSDDEVDRFLKLPCPVRTFHHHISGKEYTSLNDPKGYEMYTIFFSLLAFSGARPGEIAHIKKQNINFATDIIYIEDTKINEPRNIPISPNIKDKLYSYVNSLDHDYLFLNKHGEPVDDVDWNYNFHQRLQRLGINRPGLTPYSFRYTVITRLLESDAPLFHVQRLVGHHQVNTTAHYYRFTEKNLHTVIRKLPLVKKQTTPREILNSILEIVRGLELEKDKRFKVEILDKSEEINIKIAVDGAPALL